MNKHVVVENDDTDVVIDQLLRDYDDSSMPLPDIEFQPHLLISKVRKHYMDYIIKMLCTNYENNQRLLNKNIYLPSAIWRCAKNIEMNAAQTSMVIQLYRKNITNVLKDLKTDTMKGKLYKNLYECLRKAPENEKKVQTTDKSFDCKCQCTCNQRKRPRISSSPKTIHNDLHLTDTRDISNTHKQYVIPVIENLHTDSPKLISVNSTQTINNQSQSQTISSILNPPDTALPKPSTRLSIQSHDSDELTLQLEKIFYGDCNDDDDLFEGALCDPNGFSALEDNSKKINRVQEQQNQVVVDKQDAVTENNTAAMIKSLDERLASLAELIGNHEKNAPQQKPREKKRSSKWLCEEYFLKANLHEVLDQIRDSNRKKLSRIKQLFLYLFGDDSDDEDVLSPLDETPAFIISCKERIAPWVVKLLTPYYIKGRIKGKALFKSLAKHLIRLIYQCSQYPSEYEVHSFVKDFLNNHQMIRCEADYKQFRIENLNNI